MRKAKCIRGGGTQAERPALLTFANEKTASSPACGLFSAAVPAWSFFSDGKVKEDCARGGWDMSCASARTKASSAHLSTFSSLFATDLHWRTLARHTPCILLALDLFLHMAAVLRPSRDDYLLPSLARSTFRRHVVTLPALPSQAMVLGRPAKPRHAQSPPPSRELSGAAHRKLRRRMYLLYVLLAVSHEQRKLP
jgi:hypothetical protein